MTIDSTDLVERIVELVDLPMMRVKEAFTDFGYDSKRSDMLKECQGWSRGRMIGEIIKSEFQLHTATT